MPVFNQEKDANWFDKKCPFCKQELLINVMIDKEDRVYVDVTTHKAVLVYELNLLEDKLAILREQYARIEVAEAKDVDTLKRQ